MPRVIPILLGLLILGGCDRQSPDAGQANVAEVGATAAVPAVTGYAETERDKLGQVDRSKAGTPAPDTAFTAPDGSQTSLAAFRGRPVLVNLWATWCAPCVKEMPTLDALAVREGERMQVLVISQDNQTDKVAPFFAQAKFARLEPYLDPEMALSVGYGANLPTTILYDGEGRELWRVLGDTDWAGGPAAELIAEAF